MTDAGIFYEFPADVGLRRNPATCTRAKAVPLEGVQVGVDYALLLTTPPAWPAM